MKNYRKILAFSLSIVMLFSLMSAGSLGAFATEKNDPVTVYLDCSNVYTVKEDTVGGLFFYESRDQIYVTATLDESGLFRLEVPYASESDSMWFRCNVEEFSKTVIMSAYNWNYIPNSNLLDGLYLTGLVEGISFDRSFSDGVWAVKETGQLIGDTDGDGKLNVKDATLIQKCLVNLEDWNDKGEVLSSGHVRYIADFNFDGVRNIKDATELQRYIAWL